LRKGRSNAYVHSSYDGAVNVMTSLGLVSLVPRSAGRGPINVNIIGDFRPLSSASDCGDTVALSEEKVVIGRGTLVSLAGSKLYAPTGIFSRPRLGDDAIRGNLRLARETAIVRGEFSGMGSLLHALCGGTLSASPVGLNLYSRLVLKHLRDLISGLGDESLRRVRVAAKNIAGMGVGLTPSADDVLSGLMVALLLSVKNGLVPRPFLLRAARTIARASTGRSPSLSQEYLAQASLGRSNEKVARLVESICTGTSYDVVSGTSELIAMGHASGTDTAVGVILGVGFISQVSRRGGTP
jgi:hypothetical protein